MVDCVLFCTPSKSLDYLFQILVIVPLLSFEQIIIEVLFEIKKKILYLSNLQSKKHYDSLQSPFV